MEDRKIDQAIFGKNGCMMAEPVPVVVFLQGLKADAPNLIQET